MDEVTLIWVVRAGFESEAHQLFLESNVIALPWPAIGDLNKFATRQELQQDFFSCYPNISMGAGVGYVGQLFKFAQEMKPGDRIIYPVKQSKLLFAGIVTGDYSFNNESSGWPHQRIVNWQVKLDRTKLPKRMLQRIGAPAQLSIARLKEQELFHLAPRI